MSEEQTGREIDVYQSRRFEKSLSKLQEAQLKVVEDEIDRIIDNPLLGTQKKGDLSFLRVHKFQLNNQHGFRGTAGLTISWSFTFSASVHMKIFIPIRKNTEKRI